MATFIIWREVPTVWMKVLAWMESESRQIFQSGTSPVYLTQSIDGEDTSYLIDTDKWDKIGILFRHQLQQPVAGAVPEFASAALSETTSPVTPLTLRR